MNRERADKQTEHDKRNTERFCLKEEKRQSFAACSSAEMTMKHAVNPLLLPILALHDIFTALWAQIGVTLTSSGVREHGIVLTAGWDWEVICSQYNFIRKWILSRYHCSRGSQVIWINGCWEQLVSTHGPYGLAAFQLQEQYPFFLLPISHFFPLPLPSSLLQLSP